MGNEDARRAADGRVAGLLAAYKEADYLWELAGEWHPLAVGSPAPRLEQAFPAAQRFGLLSAWNPQSVVLPHAINREADLMLHAVLEESGLAYRPGFSAARDRSWREPSWVVMDMPLPLLDTLTRRFGQLATLSWQRGEPVRLRMHALRPAGVPDDEQADWLGSSVAGDRVAPDA